jgi:hypothetical protein
MLKQAKGEVGETFFVFGDFVVRAIAAALDNLWNPGGETSHHRRCETSAVKVKSKMSPGAFSDLTSVTCVLTFRLIT